jgi:hypothetical protein
MKMTEKVKDIAVTPEERGDVLGGDIVEAVGQQAIKATDPTIYQTYFEAECNIPFGD